MKIGILTQPLHNNYGGLLQNFALQQILKRLGHEVYTINIIKQTSKLRRFASIIKRLTLKLLGHNIRVRALPTVKETELISHNTSQFVRSNITTTEVIKSKVDSNLLAGYKFDAYIVGSDQVWRPKYSPQLPTYFLDFLEHISNVKKVAYAASFGVDKWEFTKGQTDMYKKLVKQFDAVSVREDSGVYLCKKYFDVEAVHLLDPTMLLTKDDYISLLEKANIKENSGSLFTYILDSSKEKNSIVNLIAKKFNLKPFSVIPPKRFSDKNRKGIDECVFPPVEEWIRGVMDAEFVVTDSFHGTVFSILFNKPFITIGNKDRGLSRITSLLKMFHLEDKLVFTSEHLKFDDLHEVDWERVSEILYANKVIALQYLNEHFRDIQKML